MPSLQIPSCSSWPSVVSFVFPKYLGYEDGERHSGTGIKAFREKEEVFGSGRISMSL
jgi:hypothetical protein